MGNYESNIGDSPQHPGLKIFFAIFKLIRARPDVEDVLVGIFDFEEQSEHDWPFSDAVYIFTDADKADVSLWVERLQSDEIVEITPEELAQSYALEFRPTSKIWVAWWD